MPQTTAPIDRPTAAGDATRAVLWLIAGTAALRLLIAAFMGLGIDESYMVASGRTLQLGYFDHPPIAWWLARGAARLLGSEAPVVVRLPFIALFAVSTWLTYRLGASLGSARAGLWAAVALNLAPVFGVTTGGMVLPDGPLVCALLGAAVCLTRALPARDGWGWWLGAGACAGLALLSKYTAVLTLLGAVLYLLTQPGHRRWLGRKQPWVAASVAAALFAPVLAWNATNGWASFAFQGGRAAAYRLDLAGPFAVLGGAALFLLPWIWFGLMVALLRGLRAGPEVWRSWLLCWLALPPIVLFAVIALWSRHVLFHWAAPGYLFLFPLLGLEIERLTPLLRRRLLVGTVALLAVAVPVGAAELRWHWIAAVAPGADPALQARDWTGLRDALAARGLLHRPDTVIAGASWWVTGKVDYALGGDPPVICLNTDARQYGAAPGPADFLGRDVLLVAPNLDPARAEQGYGRLFDRLETLPPAIVLLPGRGPASLPLYLGHRLRAWP